MNKFTKLSAVALFSLFLTACDKPAEAPKANEPASQATQAAAEQPAAQAPAAEPAAAATATAAEELKKLMAWGQKQQAEMLKLQGDLQQKLATQDAAQIIEAGKTFEAKFAEIQKELEAMETKDKDVNTLRLKMYSTMTLSSQLITDAVKMASDPASAASLQAEIQRKTAALQQLAADVQKTSVELMQKLGVSQ